MTQLLYVDVAADAGARVTEVLAGEGIYLSELRAEEVDLETVFLELTEGRRRSRTRDPAPRQRDPPARESPPGASGSLLVVLGLRRR